MNAEKVQIHAGQGDKRMHPAFTKTTIPQGDQGALGGAGLRCRHRFEANPMVA